MKPNYACGVDIGGSHVTAALIDTLSNALVEGTLKRSKIDASKPADEIIGNWVKIIQQALGHHSGTVNIGIAMPGPFDYENGISYIKGQHKYEALYNLNVKELLAEALQQPAQTITFANDAACFLQGEAAAGVAKGFGHAMGFTLGTGLGSAWFSHGIAEDADLWRAPFLNGIAEDYLSSRWFVKRYHELSGKTVKDVKELVKKYARNKHVQTVFEEFGANLGSFINRSIEGKDIEMIVLGGNISQSFELFASGLPAVPVIKKAVLNEHAALLGAVSINTLITAL